MKPMYLRIFVLLAMLCPLGALAQPIFFDFPGKGAVRVYKISGKEAGRLHSKENPSITEKYLYHLVDSLSATEATIKQYPPGHYIYCHVVGDEVERQLWSFQSMQVRPLSGKGEFRVQIIDKNGDPLRSAEASWRGKTLKQQGNGIYSCKTHQKRGLLRVKNEDEEYLGWWYEGRNRNTPVVLQSIGSGFSSIGKAIARPFSPGIKGYVAFSSPKYKPGDTLRAKAWIVNQYGKPVRGKMYRKLSGYGSRSPDLKERVKPDQPGVFYFEFPLPDTMKLDANYSLRFSKKSWGSRYVSEVFRYEDYLLRENEFELTVARNFHGKNDLVKVRITARDANGLGLAGAWVALKLRMEKLYDFAGGTGYYPEILWEHKAEVGTDGEMSLEIPNRVFEGVNGYYALTAEFQSGNNELSLEKDRFSKDGIGVSKTDLRLDSGRVISRDLTGTGRLLGIAERDTLIDEQVRLPLERPVDSLVRQYILVTNDKQHHLLLPPEGEVNLYGYHLGDSVSFTLHNRHQIPMRYAVRAGSKLIDAGATSDAKWKWEQPARLNAQYRMDLAYHWAGKPRYENASTSGRKNDLEVQIIHPDRVQPGETVAMQVQVVDAKNQPVANANLTSGAITGKFNRSNKPDVPHFPEKEKPDQNLKEWPWSRVDRKISSRHHLSISDGASFGIDSLEWFNMMLPPGGWYLRDLATPDGSTQFAPFARYGDVFRQFNAIWIDGKLVSLDIDSRREPYSVLVSPGFHHLKLRNQNTTLEVENVWFPAGRKLELFVDPDSPPEFCRSSWNRAYIRDEESDWFNDQILWIFDSDSSHFGRAGQGNVQRLTGPGGSWRNAGVFQPGPVWYLSDAGADTLWIDFEPGTSYLIRNGFLFHDQERTNYQRYYYLSTLSTKPGEFVPSADFLEQVQSARGYPKYFYRGHSVANSDDGPTSSLYLKSSLPYEIGFLMLVREADRVTRVFEPHEKEIDELTPGTYRFWLCRLDGSYGRGPALSIGEAGKYTFAVDEESFDTAGRPGGLISVYGNALPMDLIENKYLPGAEGYLKLQLTDAASGKPLVGEKVGLEKNGLGAETFYSDESGTVALKFPEQGWFTIDLPKNDKTKRKFFMTDFLWEGTGVQEASLAIPGYAQPESKGAGKPFVDPIRLEIHTGLFKRYVKCPKFGVSNLPARRGTRTNYLHQMGQNDQDVVYGMISRTPGNEANLFIPDPYKADHYLESTGEVDQLRSAFADQAWWQPNLTTDKNGQAFFQVTFPDDLTRWKAWAVATTRKKQSGSGRAEILSYRDLVANLSVPHFLIEGDQTQLRGEVVNHTGVSTQLSTKFEVNGSASLEKSQTVLKQFDENYPLTATCDSMQVVYRLKRDDGYGDGESRPIEILPRGILRKTGGFAYLEGNGGPADTVLIIRPDPNLGPVRLLAQARPIDFLLTEIEKLENYPYSCMEQTSSRLLALIAKKRISTAMSERFSQNKEIKTLIRRLENAQQPSGAWGWWLESTPNLFMTTVVCLALQEAQAQGYSSDALAKGKSFLQKNLPRETSADNLGHLLMAAELGIPLDYESRLAAYGVRKPSIYDRLQIARIRQLAGLPYDWAAVWEKRKESLSGGLYWGEKSDDMQINSVQATLIVYRMLQDMPDKGADQALLRRFFLEQGGNGLGRNTYESAAVLTAVLPYYLSQPFRNPKVIGSDGVVLEVAVNGKVQRMDAFPARQTVGEGMIEVKKSGRGPVFLHWYQEKREEQPPSRNKHFKASTYFEQGGKRVEFPVSGEKLSMVVEVRAIAPASYVMVEVPIPAGCVYGDKSIGRAAGEVHREYFLDRVGIFLTEMKEGKHTFRIDLEPRFPGDYTLKPVEVMPMYFPVMNGNNEVRRVEIR